MNSAVTEIDGRTIARSVAVREKALLILRSARRPPLAVALAPFAAIFLTTVGLSGLQMPFWPKTIIGAACMLAFASAASAWHLYRQLLAVIDLILVAALRTALAELGKKAPYFSEHISFVAAPQVVIRVS